MKKFCKIFGWIFLSIIALIVFVFILFNLPIGTPRQDIKLGMTFSSRYAEALGLSWQETLLAQLDELGIKHWRIPVYWDLVEATQGEPDYSAVDWQLNEIAKRDGTVILSVGQRVPRWPECHIPSWAQEDVTLREQRLLAHIERTVERYKYRDEITVWQVENEPFLSQFGECPPLDPAFLEQEIALVKKLDPTRPVLVTDSGELSLWIRAAKRGDLFGTTLYREIYTHRFGGRYIEYPVSPAFFHIKTAFTKLFTHQENFMVIELQAEPWAPGWVDNYGVEEQFKTMNEEKLRDTLVYAQRLEFPEIYLWGGEWWYYLKVRKNYDGLWETGKELFNTYQQ